mmetsp:Transcript_14243/g.46771  ORF Transcript_14243/g.46771 Transcript_14243/m.46771 type:complete len:238 (+) Transcript_14243:84-797(+)
MLLHSFGSFLLGFHVKILFLVLLLVLLLTLVYCFPLLATVLRCRRLGSGRFLRFGWRGTDGGRFGLLHARATAFLRLERLLRFSFRKQSVRKEPLLRQHAVRSLLAQGSVKDVERGVVLGRIPALPRHIKHLLFLLLPLLLHLGRLRLRLSLRLFRLRLGLWGCLCFRGCWLFARELRKRHVVLTVTQLPLLVILVFLLVKVAILSLSLLFLLLLSLLLSLLLCVRLEVLFVLLLRH